jgi:cAMP-specific phosphodiesterase 4
MSHHGEKVSKLNAVVSEFDISQGKNIEKLIEGKNESDLFKTQQFIMEAAIHSCDISQQCRSFDLAKEWILLLFEEFFIQGDVELSKELPITMLCDRNTTNVAGA